MQKSSDVAGSDSYRYTYVFRIPPTNLDNVLLLQNKPVLDQMMPKLADKPAEINADATL
ncbi:MAG: hypothetical protein Q7J34_06800 [Bacteroidales bacterium]|nr:hypothetical protein [Bacteroidales bacterium]